GLHEPSLARIGDEYFLTIRNDKLGFVTRGGDGLHFEPIRPWKFDDGRELGNYNTQQHWVTHGGALFLVYTRRGANNDHVFRHRAPLFMAQVDTERLCVIRETERVLVPERGARLGNFGVTHISDDETWVTVSEWMQPRGVERYGSDGSVFVARIQWES
ncbi:MAG: exo-alpha-sialidase, partial [Planctomycetes bacterium]|nr:exo-alpha-sialidase [Planctomycetota bacterium]